MPREFIDITSHIRQLIADHPLEHGLVTIFSPHTTAAVTINENWDPDVIDDFLLYLQQSIPRSFAGFHHCEGNSDSHILTSLVGPSTTIIVDQGQLVLGQWQGIYLCEFDGPRHRSLWIQTLEG